MSISNDSDVTICYFGGSGGFFCLYLLLLSNQYKCCFEDGTADVHKTKNEQWDIKSIPSWKDNEIWPNDAATRASSFNVNKVFFLCNPIQLTQTPGPQEDMLAKFPGKKILLYTDLATQWHLSKSKRAYWFQQGRKLNGQGLSWQTPEYRNEQVLIWYNNIKLDEWPAISHADDFYNLPDEIQKECINEHSMWEVLDIGKFDDDNYSPRGVLFNGDIVYKKVVDVMPEMDIVVKLQDLIKTQGRVLFDQLGLTTNKDIQKFIVQYLSLHDVEQQKYLLGKR